MVAIEAGDVCQFGSCNKDAEALVYSRKLEIVIKCCDVHTDEVVEQGHPEYEDVCKNCGCVQGVN